MDRPVVDEIYDILVKGDLERLEGISRPQDAVYIRTAISTESANAAGLHINLEDITSKAPWVTPLFIGPKVFLNSASTALQSHLTGGTSSVPIDWSFSFDSNVGERVRAYVNHENINKKDQDRIITLLKLKKEYSLQTDLVPFLFENLRLSREDNKNLRPLNTILAFKKLDHIDWDSFEKDPYKPKFICNEQELLKESERDYESFVTNEEVKNREYKAVFTQVILFELAILWLKNPTKPDEVFSKLIDFCVLQLGKLPKYELLVALQFLEKPKRVRFFGPLADVAKKIESDLKGMAWDISHVRTLETMSTITALGSFFLPFFVSFDDKFSELLKLNQINFLVIDDRLKRMHSASVHELRFQIKLDECMSEEVLSKSSYKESEMRKQYMLPINDLQHILKHQEVALKAIADEVRTSKKPKRNA
ncbi:hypothetical protein AB6C96_11385 [Vibrio cyclitrophicus]